MTFPDLPKIIETPSHFWFGPVDLAYACQGDTKTEQLPGGYVKVTKTFVARSYQQLPEDQAYDFNKPTELGKQ